MKILFIVTAFPRDEADVITPWLIETARRLGDRGITVEVLAPSYRGLGDQVVHGIRVHRFRYAPRVWETLTHDQTAPDRIREHPAFAALLPGYLAAGAARAARLARTGEFALAHAFWPLPHGLLALAAKRVTGIPVVSTFFGVELTWVAGQLAPLRPLVAAIIRGSDRVTAISTYTAGLVRKLVPTVDPVVIPFGAAVEPTDEVGIRDAGGDFRVLFVGRLVERKGVHLLLDAVAQVAGDPGIHLDVVGEGPERARLEKRASTLGISRRVSFHGFVSTDELRSRVAASSCLVLPAIRDAKGDVEGLGVVLLEAMSFGVPVIGSAAGGIVDIVEHERTGLLVPPGDVPALASAIRRYREEPALASRLGAAGRSAVAERFGWDSVIDRLVALYEETAGVRPASR